MRSSKRLLRRRKIDARAIAAAKSVDLHRHLLALEPRGESEEHARPHRPARAAFTASAVERLVRRRPDELQSRVAIRLLRPRRAADSVRPASQLHRRALRQSRIRKLAVVRRIHRRERRDCRRGTAGTSSCRRGRAGTCPSAAGGMCPVHRTPKSSDVHVGARCARRASSRRSSCPRRVNSGAPCIVCDSKILDVQAGLAVAAS